MRIRSFIIAYALVLAILLFADRRPAPISQGRYSHVIDLTGMPNAAAQNSALQARASQKSTPAAESRTRIVAPDALIPGTWTAGQIPAERLIAPLVVMDLNVPDLNASAAANPQISLDDIASWETQHGAIPQGAVVAVRRTGAPAKLSSAAPPISTDAAQFLMEARYTTGFAFETPVEFTTDRTLARQIALHGNYIVEAAARFTALPATGSIIIVAPAKNKSAGRTPVRVLAMVR